MPSRGYPPNKKLLLTLAALLVIVVCWAPAFVHSNALEVTFLDVGEGLCAVIRTPRGKTMVVDCGTTTWAKSDEIGERLTARYLQSLGVDTIDVVVLTHPHLDHVSGMAGLIGTKPARMVIDIGVRHRGSAYKAFLQSAQACGAVYRIAKRGQIIDFGDGVISEILNPHPVDN